MDTSLTIVLPIHNAEAQLRRNVERVLEVAAELTPRFELLIVDDGSTDDSFEIANEIAAKFPQVSVVRSGSRQGLGGTLRDVKRRAAGRVVIVHDGVSTINANELRTLYMGADDDLSIEDLRRPAATHAAMVAAHSRLRGFQVIEVEPAQANVPAPLRAPRGERAEASKSQPGVGQIPPLPKPNFLGAMGDFALGE
ncbi:putative glycosyl transferase [Posidoniimonas polymericola]|uniref:Putative glycosyl transferase n=1 Tax=Posidoniimonas polymericola TaxID=2528002 RepID=A0A5C5YGX8_9BACT|nr:glycosyltransferase [Posidoniimonas polymericola]TWT73735.1 putative glycosyl transferase [Posidoniimonas polymericola]